MKVVETQTSTDMIDTSKPLFCDIETHGLYLEVCLFQMYQTHWREAIVVKYPDINWLRNLIFDSWTVWYNASYDLGTLEISPSKFDCLFYASKLAFPSEESYSLDSIERKLGITHHSDFKKKELQKSFASAKCKKEREFTDEQLRYAAADTYGLSEMYDNVEIQMAMKTKIYSLDIQAQKDALVYQQYGLPVNPERLRLRVNKTHRFINMNARRLPKGLNVNSHAQVSEYLGTPDAQATTLKRLVFLGNQDAVHILRCKQGIKELGLLEKTLIGVDRVRGFFTMSHAITGRAKCTGGDRNGYISLQTLPRNVKYVFGYSEQHDRKIVNADYSTAELIAGCSIMQSYTMRDLILKGVDLHKSTAQNLLRCPLDAVTKEQRQMAKAINFGFIFGMGHQTVVSYAKDSFGVDLTVEEARKYKTTYQKTYPEIKKYQDYISNALTQLKDFKVMTAMGRKKGNLTYTQALNIPIQGSIAEAVKIAITYMFEHFPDLVAENPIINMVHDSIVGDVHKDKVEEWANAVAEAMAYGWREISKSTIFKFKDLPMLTEVSASHLYNGDDYFFKVYEG